MVYLFTVKLDHRSKSYTYITHRSNYLTATILDCKFAFRNGEYRLMNQNAALTAPSHYVKEVVDDQDWEETVRWLSRLRCQEDGSTSPGPGPAQVQNQAGLKKHL